MFHILSKKHGTDRFEEWEDKADKNLISNIRKGNFEAIERYNDLVDANKNEIDQYKFEQNKLKKIKNGAILKVLNIITTY